MRLRCINLYLDSDTQIGKAGGGGGGLMVHSCDGKPYSFNFSAVLLEHCVPGNCPPSPATGQLFSQIISIFAVFLA